MTAQAKAVIAGASLTWGVTSEVTLLGESAAEPNSPPLSALLKEASLRAGVPPSEILDAFDAPGSEDATFLMRAVHQHGGLAFYAAFGSNVCGGHHHPKFDFDEELLLRAVKVLWEFCRLAGPGQHVPA